MASEPGTKLTYEALWEFPDDNRIREVIGGELFVTPQPTSRHQDVVAEILYRLRSYEKAHGGKALTAPTGVFLSETDFVEPDVLYLGPESPARVERAFIRGAPDLVVEVSSPSTRKRDVTTKRTLYERFGVAEYWFVDLDEDTIAVHRRAEEGFGPPQVLGRGDVLTSPLLPGFSASMEELLGPPEA